MGGAFDEEVRGAGGRARGAEGGEGGGGGGEEARTGVADAAAGRAPRGHTHPKAARSAWWWSLFQRLIIYDTN